ncbi:MAG: galactokinase [Tissierellia bacterium]|nr:galactokinase [Tissierellia bacterium]
MINNLVKQFIDSFGENEHEIRKFFSPSRINIIGEHIDYNGGKVFPCPLEIGTYGIARKNDDNVLRLKSLNMDHQGEISLDNLIYVEENDWMNYAAGMLKFIADEGYHTGGLDILVFGDIPNGAGLSSSASLELLIGEIVNQIYNDGEIQKENLALIGKKTENEFIGLNSGIMDQFIIAVGKKDHATLIDTNTLDYRHIPFQLDDTTIVILNTNKRRELKDSKYNERRSECDLALELLKPYKPEITALCDLTEDDLHLLENIEDENVRKRAEHAIRENARVYKAIEALEENDIETLGSLLVQSNDSLRELFEVTGPHLDSITKHANSFEHCLGARMTGAGFGGCGISIVKNDEIENFKAHVAKGYKEDTGLDAEFIISQVGDGVHEL